MTDDDCSYSLGENAICLQNDPCDCLQNAFSPREYEQLSSVKTVVCSHSLGEKHFWMVSKLRFYIKLWSQTQNNSLMLTKISVFSFFVDRVYFFLAVRPGGTDGRLTDGRTVGRLDREMEGGTDGWTDGLPEGCADRRIDVRADGWTNGRPAKKK